MDYVLVHGGATTGGYWDLVAPLLSGAVLAVDLPGRRAKSGDLEKLTVDEAATSVVGDIETAGLGSEIVLVAHSSGGLEVPAIATALGSPRVRAIVLNAASVPPEGGNGFDCMREHHRELSLQALAAADASGTTITTTVPDSEAMRTSSGEELDDVQHAFITDPSRSVPDSFNLYRGAVRWSTAAGIPVTYIVNTRDRALPPALQIEMAGRLPTPPSIVELNAGHLAAVTHPEDLAAIISSVGR